MLLEATLRARCSQEPIVLSSVPIGRREGGGSDDRADGELGPALSSLWPCLPLPW